MVATSIIVGLLPRFIADYTQLHGQPEKYGKQ